ncbi:hypothetical protein [Saccharothrix sp. ST-888]|uniref:hypothetical protein n=1 Tax=Saccharothrix sp. ST-888 TaxID=1427391 RepID=UPI000ABFE7FA|nr:hypothetical protein [Saccharothrix sp. ST-888]
MNVRSAVVERSSQMPGIVVGEGRDGRFVVALVGGAVRHSLTRDDIRPADTSEALRVQMAVQRTVHRIRHAGT